MTAALGYFTFIYIGHPKLHRQITMFLYILEPPVTSNPYSQLVGNLAKIFQIQLLKKIYNQRPKIFLNEMLDHVVLWCNHNANFFMRSVLCVSAWYFLLHCEVHACSFYCELFAFVIVKILSLNSNIKPFLNSQTIFLACMSSWNVFLRNCLNLSPLLYPRSIRSLLILLDYISVDRHIPFKFILYFSLFYIIGALRWRQSAWSRCCRR